MTLNDISKNYHENYNKPSNLLQSFGKSGDKTYISFIYIYIYMYFLYIYIFGWTMEL